MLLERFGVPFDCQSPDIDETMQAREVPAHLVARLAAQKADAVARNNPQAVVIGSDQLAVFDGQIIGKPGDFETALAQLMRFSGNAVEFLTAVSVQSRYKKFSEQFMDTTRVHFRNLRPEEIKRYLEKEKPFDCVGAFKAELSGIVLFERVTSEDPTALIGLPLIRTAAALRRAGLQLP
jgi:septum formation protein